MATMPGLPMFGHGQVEGFTERYGMEYRRAYYEEAPDRELIARHDRQIAPLLHRRELFAQSSAFRLYDFFTDDGWVNEDVFAYSNRRGDERALVVYHNRYATTQGWIRTSCAYAEKTGGGGRRLVQQTLGEALGVTSHSGTFLLCRDAATGLEYLHRSDVVAEKGLRLELHAYTCHVFLGWREIAADDARPWEMLAERLAGRGVPNMEEAMRLLLLEPVHASLRAVLDPALVGSLGSETAGRGEAASALADAASRVRAFLDEVSELARRSPDITTGNFRGDITKAVHVFETRLHAALKIAEVEARLESPWPRDTRALFAVESQAARGAMLAWSALEALGLFCDPSHATDSTVRLFDDLRLRGVLAEAVQRLGVEGEEGWRVAARVRVAFAHARRAPGAEAGDVSVTLGWLRDPDAAWLTGVNEYQGARYFVRESFERLVWWLALPRLLRLAVDASPPEIRALERDVAAYMRAAAAAGYCVPSAG